MRTIWMTIGIVVASCAMAQGADSVDRANPLRKILIDTIRPAVQADLGGIPVQFVIDVLQVDGRWAYLAGSVQNTDGSPIDFGATHYAEAQDHGAFDGPAVKALMQKSGNCWTLTTFNIGATDVIEGGWPAEFGVPCSVVNFC